MGLSLDKTKPAWGCFRNNAHRGRSPVYLIAHLLHISMREAQQHVGTDTNLIDDFDTVVERIAKGDDEMLQPQAEINTEKQTNTKALPKEFRDLSDRARHHYRDRFINYLAHERGFGEAAAEDVSQNYFLYYALTGEQAWRLIFPVEGGWTGRAIGKDVTLRYRESEGLGKKAVLTLPHAFVESKPPNILAICEGPLDALKIDYYGRHFGIQAVATMGVAVTAEQVMRLRNMIAEPEISHVWTLFDQNTTGQTMSLHDSLIGLRKPCLFATPMDGYKDVGEYSPADATSFCKYLAGKTRELHHL